MAPTAYEPYRFNVTWSETRQYLLIGPLHWIILLQIVRFGASLTNGETLRKRFKPHSSTEVAFGARSHVDAIYAKRTPQKFPRLRLPREANFCVLSPPPLTLRPSVRTAFRRALGTIIATTKEE